MAAAFPPGGPVTLDITASAETPAREPVTACTSMSFTGVAYGSPMTVRSPDSLLVMDFPADALYRSAPVMIEPVQVRPANGLKLVSDGYLVRLFDDPPHNAADLPSTVEVITTDELYAGIDYQPLNLGTALGRLRFITAAELEIEYVSYRDIVVLDNVPNDISVVMG
ncbi:MAG TPA: hypothetical protein PK405_00420, partial [Hyphomicrobiales bacterium]|nr:hypothetical protein [Hyphomicrobiales bacterium]